MLKIVNIKLPIDYTKEELEEKVCSFLRVDKVDSLILDCRETVKKENEI